MRTYQKGFEQNSLVTISTFIALYCLAFLSVEAGSIKVMFSGPYIITFFIIMGARFFMLQYGKDEKKYLLISRILVYMSALFWSLSYGSELVLSGEFSDSHMLLIIFIMGIAAAGAMGLSKDARLTRGFLISLLLPAAGFSFFFLQRLSSFIGTAFLMYFAYLLLYSKKYYLLSQENLIAKKELEQQKDELERNHHELSSQNSQLSGALSRAKSADKAKSLFLANMSHEIRTPLNGIIGMAHLMQQDEKDNEQKKKISIIQFSAETLVSLVNDILDFSKIEAGKLELDVHHFNLHETIEKIEGLFSLKAGEKNLSFNIKIANNIPVYIISDQIRLKQIIINLINNAIKFTNQGSVSLIIKASKQENGQLKLKFEIKDTGIGISQENQSKIFSPFTQSDASFTRKFGGTGLGLAISRRLVKLLGGKMGVESDLNLGSTFWFTIITQEGEEQIEKNEILSTETIKGLNILLAEDNKVNVIVAKQIILKAGHQVVIANNGLEAVEMFKKEKFDLILMDIMMPEMDGLTASNLIRSIENESELAFTPIIALTANVIKKDQQKYIEAGMNDFISKPIHPDILLQKIQEIFKNSNSS